MPEQHFGTAYGANPAESYERFFVPAIGAPLALSLVGRAAIQPGEKVLGVACGTGVVARPAADAVGSDGAVAGVDISPGMLAVARSMYVQSTPLAAPIGQADEAARAALERDVVSEWQTLAKDGALICPQRIVIASGKA